MKELENPSFTDFMTLGKAIARLQKNDRLSLRELAEHRETLQRWSTFLGDVKTGLELVILDQAGCTEAMQRANHHLN